MAICSAAGRMSVAPTAARGPSLYATAAIRPQILEIGVWNTTTTAAAIGVARATATGTQGAGLTEVCLSDDSKTPVATGFQTHTADATLGAQIVQAALAGAVGSGVIWRWNPGDFVIDNLTTAGVVIFCPTGTGQICDFYFKWVE